MHLARAAHVASVRTCSICINSTAAWAGDPSQDASMQRPSSLPLLLSSLLQVDLSPAHVNVMLALLFLSFGSRLQVQFQHSATSMSSAARLAPQCALQGFTVSRHNPSV